MVSDRPLNYSQPMTTLDAAQLLELPANATPAQVEARVRKLRTLLDDKAA